MTPNNADASDVRRQEMPGETMYDKAMRLNRAAYDAKVGERDDAATQPWKAGIRQGFLERLRHEGKLRLLDIGAGVGTHAVFFQNAGLEVVSIDASPAMVEACRAKGLEAWAMDFLALSFEKNSFDAAFAMNSFLHVPRADLLKALAAVRFILRPSGLFCWGQYGGYDYEGALEDDHYEPRRFFSLLSDETYRTVGAAVFSEVDFEAKRVSEPGELHYQSAIWRREH